MKLLVGMPGGSEWIFIIIVLGFLICIPVFAIKYFTKYKETKRQNQILIEEKNRLLEKILKEK